MELEAYNSLTKTELFHINFCKTSIAISKNTYFTEQLLVAASGKQDIHQTPKRYSLSLIFKKVSK